MQVKNLKWIWVGTLIVSLGWFIFLAQGKYDPDFGWHLKTGELVLTQGVPKTDPFSYTMPSFGYIDHAWLTDTFIAWAYPKLGDGGLAIVFAVIAWLALIVAVRKKFTAWALIPWWTTLAVVSPRFGVRTQVVDWLMWAIVWWLVEDDIKWKKWRWLAPGIIGLWTNLHGGFVVGLLSVGWRVWWNGWREKKLVVKDGMVIILAMGATLINPYGWGLWREVGMTIWGNNLQSTIVEWMPFYTYLEMGFLMTVPILGLVIWRYRNRVVKWKAGWMVGMIAASMSSLRHTPLFMLAAINEVNVGLGRFEEEVKDKPEAEGRLKAFWKLLAGIALLVWLLEISANVRCVQTGCLKRSYYPDKAIAYLQKEQIGGNMFSLYSWGGYLIWKMPEKKTFTDGRMAIWRQETAPDGESRNAYADYLAILEGKNSKELLQKYQVKVVLWPAKQIYQPSVFTVMEDWIIKMGWWKRTPGNDFRKWLTSQGWKEVYKDGVAQVYVSPKEW